MTHGQNHRRYLCIETRKTLKKHRLVRRMAQTSRENYFKNDCENRDQYSLASFDRDTSSLSWGHQSHLPGLSRQPNPVGVSLHAYLPVTELALIILQTVKGRYVRAVNCNTYRLRNHSACYDSTLSSHAIKMRMKVKLQMNAYVLDPSEPI